MADVWNAVAWPLPVAPSTAQLACAGPACAAYNGTHLALHALALCPLDTLPYYPSSSSSCSSMQCLRLREACGANSIRIIGSALCVCLPGYYRPLLQPCTLCPSNSYCPGGTLSTPNPIPCGPNAVSKPGASTIAECMCERGFYPFTEAFCQECPIGFWCLGGRMLPIPCINSGITPTTGSSTPLACACPSRTYGFLCTPCTDAELCTYAPSSPQWSAIRILAWGPATLSIQSCVLGAQAAVYSVPGPPLAPGDLAMNYSWGWILSLQVGTDTALMACLASQPGFVLHSAAPFASPQPNRNFKTNVPCGPNQEWDGDPVTQKCTCIAGYALKRYAGYDVCVPCLNGTMRPRRSPIPTCVKCPREGNNTAAMIAPWLGMARCICPSEASYWDVDAQACLPLPLSFLDTHPLLRSVPFMVTLSLFFGLLCLCAFVLAPRALVSND